MDESDSDGWVSGGMENCCMEPVGSGRELHVVLPVAALTTTAVKGRSVAEEYDALLEMEELVLLAEGLGVIKSALLAVALEARGPLELREAALLEGELENDKTLEAEELALFTESLEDNGPTGTEALALLAGPLEDNELLEAAELALLAGALETKEAMLLDEVLEAEELLD
jgi:hypothetical protein